MANGTFTLPVVPARGSLIGMARSSARTLRVTTASALAMLFAGSVWTPAEARFPARLIVTCAPQVRCTDRDEQLHRVEVGVSYSLELPVGLPATVGSAKRRTIQKALRFRTREIRPKESEQVLFYADVTLSPSSAAGGFVGTRKLRLEKVARRTEPITCVVAVTVCSGARLAVLGVAPSRRERLCARALRKLRRRVGIIDVATPPVTFPVDRCPQPRPPRTTTTTSSTSSTTSSTSTSTTTTTPP